MVFLWKSDQAIDKMSVDSREKFDDIHFPPAKKLKTRLREYAKVPVEICENHDAVLYPIHRAIASKHLPFKGITLIHFDSHPDLTIPAKMPADWVFDTDRLSEAISIADWILPVVYAGHINRVVWVKPDWADQMEGNAKMFYIGKHRETGHLRLTCKDDYFVEELLYSKLEELEDVEALELKIVTYNSSSNEAQITNDALNKKLKDCEEITNVKKKHKERQNVLDAEVGLFKDTVFTQDNVNKSQCFAPLVGLLSSLLVDNQPYILDIDMDFFSTKNPFMELFSEEEFQCLAAIYKFKPPLTNSEEDLRKCILERTSQLESIESTLSYAKELEKTPGTLYTCTNGSQLNQKLLQLIKDIRSGSSHGEAPDFELIHSAGMTIDLPHHISTKEEIDNLLNLFYATITSLPKPTIITMARSAYDEYAPPYQINYLQNSLINILCLVYGKGSIDIHLDY